MQAGGGKGPRSTGRQRALAPLHGLVCVLRGGGYFPRPAGRVVGLGIGTEAGGWGGCSSHSCGSSSWDRALVPPWSGLAPNLVLPQRSWCHWGCNSCPPAGAAAPAASSGKPPVSSMPSDSSLGAHIPSPQAHLVLLPCPPETGGICIAPRPSEEGAEILPGMAMRPFFGIIPVLMDEEVRRPCRGISHPHVHPAGSLAPSPSWPRPPTVPRHACPAGWWRGQQALRSPWLHGRDLGSLLGLTCCSPAPG